MVELRGICLGLLALSPRYARCLVGGKQFTGLFSFRKLRLLPPCSIPLATDQLNIKGHPNGCPLTFGGGEGNRTPVRKHIHFAFYGCSLFQDLALTVKTNKSYKSQPFNS